MNRGLKFEDVALIPRKSIVDSRAYCDTSVMFGSRKFKFGVFPSNMKSVVDYGTCEFLAESNLFYIMHRFDTDPLKFTKHMHELDLFASISVGVDKDSYSQLSAMQDIDVCPEYITIDVANAYSSKCERMVGFILEHFPASFLIVGNCATAEAADAIDSWGANAIKVGIANGSVCTTYNQTGFGVPQFTALLETTSATPKPIISDGGIQTIGDIAKAFVAGAKMVMSGSMFAGYDQSAGDILTLVGGAMVKRYFGSASLSNGNTEYIEGMATNVPYRGSMLVLIEEIHDGLQSAISYAGGHDINAFRQVAWIEI